VPTLNRRSRHVDTISPPADLHTSEAAIRALLEQDCPALAREVLQRVDEGRDNSTWRLGDHLAVRLPRREAAVPFLVNEQRWLPLLAPILEVEVPLPVHLGVPSPLFPFPWSVVRWVPGATAEGHGFGVEGARRLAGVLRGLHREAPEEAPVNPLRGGSLHDRREVVEERLGRLPESLGESHDWAGLEGLWLDALDAPPPEERVWLHGDLHPRNVVIRDGLLAGLLDWGDVTAGDVATDLASGWMLFDTVRVRREFFRAAGAPEPTLRRAAGWALVMSLTLVDSGDARQIPLGVVGLRRLAEYRQEPLQIMRREGLQKIADRAKK